MRKRTQAREIALQGLYQYDIQKALDAPKPEELDSFIDGRTEDPEVRRYARVLLDGTIGRLDDLDARIAAASRHWKIQRIAAVDRCVLRIAIFELLESEDAPPKVAINEAIDLAKRYSTEASGSFVNGILDTVWRELAAERKSG